jgi:transcriptional regulator with XRE-family HTH domain
MKKAHLIRDHKLLSQQDLADFLFVSRSHINMFEQGKRSLPTEAHDKLVQLEAAWQAAEQEPEDIKKKRYRKATRWDNSQVLQVLEDRIAEREWTLQGFEGQLKLVKEEHQKLVRWLEVFGQFIDSQPPGTKKRIEKWMGYYLFKLQKKIDAADPEKQFLLQFSIDTLKAEISVAREAKEKMGSI